MNEEEPNYERIYFNCMEAVAVHIANGNDPEDHLVTELLSAAEEAKEKVAKKSK